VSAFTLKIIALMSMLVDHAGIIMPEAFGLPHGMNIFRVIGRLAFPIFVYLVAEGFRHTKSPEKFLLRLGIFALISEIPFDIAFKAQINFFAETNIFYTLFLGGAAIYTYEKISARLQEKFRDRIGSHGTADQQAARADRCRNIAIIPACIFPLIAELLSSDYGAGGVAFVFIMYLVTPLGWRLAAMAVLCLWQHADTIIFVLSGGSIPAMFLWMIPATLASVALVAFYNGKRGPDLKWLFYAAYPAHILILHSVEVWIL